MKEDFIRSQTISLKAKRANAGKVIALYSAAAAGIAASPRPIADAAILPLQIAMTTQIINSYGFISIESVVEDVVGSAIMRLTLQPYFGRELVKKALIRIIPVVGRGVHAAAISKFTAALGCAVSQICFECCKKIAKGENVDFEKEVIEMRDLSYYFSNYFRYNIKKIKKNPYFGNQRPDKNKVNAIIKKYTAYNGKNDKKQTVTNT